MANETTDVVILQLKIDEGTGKKLPEAKKEVEVLAGSIVGLAKANKQLREERNKLDTQTAEGAKRIQELNKLIDENNDLIKQNSSNLEKQRMNVGNYKRGVTDALKEVRIGGINVGDVVDKLSKANEDLFQGMIQGWKDSGVSAKLFGTTARTALTLTGIGILIAALGTIVAYWDDISEAIGLADSKQKQFLDNARRELDEQNALLARRVQLMELWGASQAEINKLTIPNLKEQIALNQKEIEQLEKEIKLADFRNDLLFNKEERQEAIDALKKSNEDLMFQITTLSSKEQKAHEDEMKRRDEEAQKKAEEAEKKAKADKEKEDKENYDVKKYAEGTAAKLEADRIAFEERQRLNDEMVEMASVTAGIRSNVEVDTNAAMNRMIVAQNKRAEDQSIEYKKAGNKIKKMLDEDAFATTASLISRAASMFRENTIAYKVLASAEAVMNTYAGAARALKDYAPPVSYVFAGITIATGLANVAKINNVKFAQGGEVPKKYATGGPVLVGGRPHSQGGTTYMGEDGNRFEVERGEGIYVLKRSAQEQINYLSTVNQRHGGKSFGQKTWYAAMGGQIETRDIASRSNSANRLASIERLLTTLRPVVYVADIREGVNTAVETEVRSAPM